MYQHNRSENMASHSINRYSLIFLALFIPILLGVSPPSRIYTYTSGETINPDEVTANEDAIFNYLSRAVEGIEDDSVTTSKILDGTIVNADISASAGITYGKLAGSIPDSKLDQIITPGKVSGLALTSLANVPSGAGELPDVNKGFPVVLTTDVTGELPNANLAAITTASKVNTSSLYGTAYLPDSTVDTTALKTTTGEVSTGTDSVNLALPGGEYGFWPQVKHSTSDGKALVHVQTDGGTASGQTYISRIGVNNLTGGTTFYAKQRYVTASGQDMWIFLLLDKSTKRIVSSYQSPDHPAYGNGGNFDKVPHPFGQFDETKYEVVLLDKETASLIKSQVTEGRSILTIINEDYKPDFSSEKTYQPLHSGKYLKENKDGKQVQVRQMVNSIPSYIKVRGLVKK